jgi:hypothetical protein
MSLSRMPNKSKTGHWRFSCEKAQAEEKIAIKIEMKGERALCLDGNVYSIS